MSAVDSIDSGRTTVCINGRWRSVEIRSCAGCGRPRRVRTDSKSKLCRRCSAVKGGKIPKGKRGKTRPCLSCGKGFYAPPSHLHQSYCSTKCAGAARRAEGKPAKVQARMMANNAQRDGMLARQPCERCGNPKAEKHHKDYTKPLDVQWLCHKCHDDDHVESGSLKAKIGRRSST